MLIAIKKTNHKCKRCGKCCEKHPFPLAVTPMDILQISEFLGISKEKFVKEYCQIVDLSRDGSVKAYALKENNYIKKKRYCVFYDQKKGCKIHDVSPKQCREYPFFRDGDRYLCETEVTRNCGNISESVEVRAYLAQHPRNTDLEFEMSKIWTERLQSFFIKYPDLNDITSEKVFETLHLGLKEMTVKDLERLFEECHEMALEELNQILRFLGIDNIN